MEVGDSALTADEGFAKSDHLEFFVKFEADVLLLFNGTFFFLYEFLVNAGSFVECAPDATQLCEGSEVGALQLVDVVVKAVAALDEIWDVWLDCELYFAEHFVIELHINKDVVGAAFQSVFDPDYFELLRVVFAQSFNFFIYSDNLTLLGGAFASHGISYFEAEKVGWWWPIWWVVEFILLVNFFGNFHESMNKSVKISDDIAMYVFDYFGGEFSTNFFELIHVKPSLFFFKFMFHDLCLHFKVVVWDFIHKLFYLLLFFFEFSIDLHLHPGQHDINISSF